MPTQPLTVLPFVKRHTDKSHDFWSVPDTDDYDSACAVGFQHAASYAQYLKTNPGEGSGKLLKYIIDGMERRCQGANLGYRDGFFCYIEHLIFNGAQMDLMTDVQRLQAFYVRSKRKPAQ